MWSDVLVDKISQAAAFRTDRLQSAEWLARNTVQDRAVIVNLADSECKDQSTGRACHGGERRTLWISRSAIIRPFCLWVTGKKR